MESIVSVPDIDVGIDGSSLGTNPQNISRFIIDQSDILVNVSDDLRVGGLTLGTLLLEQGRIDVVAGGDVLIGGNGGTGGSMGAERTNITVRDNGELRTSNIVVGDITSASAAVANASGKLSKLNISGGGKVIVGDGSTISIGKVQEGQINVGAGGTLAAAGSTIQIGVKDNLAPLGMDTTRGKGLLEIQGTNAEVNARFVDVGTKFAKGTVNVLSGGTLNVEDQMNVGIQTNTATGVAGGTVTVNGSAMQPSTVNTDGLLVGRDGKVTVGAHGTWIDIRDIAIRNVPPPQPGLMGKGTIEVLALGTLEARGGLNNRGNFRIETNGIMKTQAERFFNAGSIFIGTSPGEFKLDGNFQQNSEGVLFIELAGTTTISEYDVLDINDFDNDAAGGHAILGGTLDVSLISSFVPALGNSFDVVRAQTLSGRFSDVVLPALAEGLKWCVQYVDTDEMNGEDTVRLCVVEFTPGLTTAKYTSDAEYLSHQQSQAFAAEGRIGDRSGKATFEVDLGPSTSQPASTKQFNWQSGVSTEFSLEVENNGSTQTATFTVGTGSGSATTTYTYVAESLTDLFLRTRAIAKSSMLLDNLVLTIDGNGTTITETAYANALALTSGSVIDVLHVGNVDLTGGFTLTGNATMTWTGTAPKNSNLAFQILVGTAVDDDCGCGEEEMMMMSASTTAGSESGATFFQTTSTTTNSGNTGTTKAPATTLAIEPPAAPVKQALDRLFEVGFDARADRAETSLAVLTESATKNIDPVLAFGVT